MLQIINLTGKTLVIINSDGFDMAIKPETTVAKVQFSSESTFISSTDMIKIKSLEFGKVKDLPAENENHLYIVNPEVKNFLSINSVRKDILSYRLHKKTSAISNRVHIKDLYF